MKINNQRLGYGYPIITHCGWAGWITHPEVFREIVDHTEHHSLLYKSQLKLQATCITLKLLLGVYHCLQTETRLEYSWPHLLADYWLLTKFLWLWLRLEPRLHQLLEQPLVANYSPNCQLDSVLALRRIHNHRKIVQRLMYNTRTVSLLNTIE
jgi:hypothetical protein